MELYVDHYANYVVELWQKFITRLIHLLLNKECEENVRVLLCLVYTTKSSRIKSVMQKSRGGVGGGDFPHLRPSSTVQYINTESV